MKNSIVIVGSGLMTHAMVDYFIHEKFKITMVNIDIEMTAKVLKKYDPKCYDAIHWLNSDPKILKEAIVKSGSKIVISMIPPKFHPVVAKVCVELKKHMLTCSYITEEMKKCGNAFEKNGIVWLNELGECPGIDHMVTTVLIDKVKKEGGKIKKINSYCSGIPSHEYNNNPFMYKFNWSPSGLFVSSQTSSTYLKNGKLREIRGDKLFDNYKLVDIQNLGTFECYPNKKIDKYIDLFNLGDIKNLSFFRGLLRHPGYCSNFMYMIRIGLFNGEYVSDLESVSYAQYLGNLIGYKVEGKVDKEVLAEKLAEFLKVERNSNIIHRLKWLGLFSDEIIGLKKSTNSNATLKKMLEKLKYEKGEKDLIICHIEIIYEDKENKEKKLIGSMNLKGVPNGFSAMTRAVGYNCAMSANWLLQNETKKVGLAFPCGWSELSENVLNEMKEFGFVVNYREE